MTKVIAFSLWGKNPKYTIGAIRNAELAKEIYPKWKVWVYVSEDVPKKILDELISLDCYVLNMGEGNWNGMFWRFKPAANSDITMISRDTDSRLSYREKAAVDEWLDSDKDFHIMRDHPYHATEILGGMWGARNGILSGIQEMMASYDKGDFDNRWQVDQNFLKEIIYPIIKDNTVVHDEYFELKPFPTARIDAKDFIGQSYDENEIAQF
jgi:hypothetical protein